MRKRLLTILISLLLLASILIVPISAETKTADEIAAKAVEITRSFEGVYSSVCLDDCGAVSIGYLQWHASRALQLVRDVINANPSNAKTILGTTLYNEVMNSSTTWNTRILTQSEGDKVSKLLDTDEGHAAEDALAKKDVLGYVKHGQSMGITDPVALVYFADTENQCGAGGSARIAKAAAVLAGNSFSDITVDILHKAALEDGAAGKYPVRRSKAYNSCLLIPWGPITLNYDYEVWDVKGSWTLRSGPTTDYELLGSIYDGTQMVILEKYAEDEYTWGRTYMGWFCIYKCSYVSGSIPTPVLFNVNGGEPNTTGAQSTLDVDGLNSARGSNMLVIYNGEYGTKTGTNKYGREVVVDSKGKVLTEPTYGSCNLDIPRNCYVISGHGSAGEKLAGSVKKGSYVHFDYANMKLETYESYDEYSLDHFFVKYGEKFGTLPKVHKDGVDFEDWFLEKQSVSEGSKSASHYMVFLDAKWKPKADITINYNPNGGVIDYETARETLTGFNVPMIEDGLVLYNGFNRSTTTGTDENAREALVSADGTVVQVMPAGVHDCVIPEGGFVLSGSGKSANWIASNLKVGNYIATEGTSIKVFGCYENYAVNDAVKVMANGDRYGTLPIPRRDGYVFAGWKDETGTIVDFNGKVNGSGSITLTAVWTKSNKGAYLTEASVSGFNVEIGDNSLVVYAGCLSTNTNKNCAEAVVDRYGKVISINPYNGNTKVPNGCMVVSGSGAFAKFVNNYLKIGNYVEISGNSVKVYASK